MHLNFFSSTWVRDRESLVRDSNALIKLNVLLFPRLFSSPLPVFVTLWRGHLIYWPCIPIAHKCCKLQIKRRSFVCMHGMGMPWWTYLIQRHFLVISCWVDCVFLFFCIHATNVPMHRRGCISVLTLKIMCYNYIIVFFVLFFLRKIETHSPIKRSLLHASRQNCCLSLCACMFSFIVHFVAWTNATNRQK